MLGVKMKKKIKKNNKKAIMQDFTGWIILGVIVLVIIFGIIFYARARGISITEFIQNWFSQRG